MIIDGKKIAGEIKQELKNKIAERKLRLDVILVGDNFVSQKYVERKKKFGAEIGVEVIVHELMSEITQADLEEEIEKLNNDEKVNGIIVQLPLFKQIDEQKILNLISPDKDVDALGGEARVLSPTVGAIKEILNRNLVSIKDKKVIVIGNGKLVGRPVSIWLTQEGARVSVIDLSTPEPEASQLLQSADIIVSGVGKPGLIKPASIKTGVILIDAGTSEIVDTARPGQTKLAGDADPACASKCSLFTPVPGGVGPITVAMLFKNLLTLFEVEP